MNDDPIEQLEQEIGSELAEHWNHFWLKGHWPEWEPGEPCIFCWTLVVP